MSEDEKQAREWLDRCVGAGMPPLEMHSAAKCCGLLIPDLTHEECARIANNYPYTFWDIRNAFRNSKRETKYIGEFLMELIVSKA